MNSSASIQNLVPCSKKQSPVQRKEHVVQAKLCFLCLKAGHDLKTCESSYRCNYCNGKHHILMHDALSKSSNRQKTPQSQFGPNRQSYVAEIDKESNDSNDSNESNDSSDEVQNYSANCPPVPYNFVVLMSTALIKLISQSGKSIVLRALLDTASNSSFVSEHAALSLKLTRRLVKSTVFGINSCKAGKIKEEVSLSVSPITDCGPILPFTALVLNNLTRNTPSVRVTNLNWPHISQLKLADPTFSTPGPIDVILGADLTGFPYKDGTHSGSVQEPVAKLTIFGWVLSELFWEPSFSTSTSIEKNLITCLSSSLSDNYFDLDVSHTKKGANCDLQKFWEVEDLHDNPIPSEEEERCEQLFTNSVQRNREGRYIVSLPFKLDPEKYLQSNVKLATRLFFGLENRLQENPAFSSKYIEFMSEYQVLDHMSVSSAPLTHSHFLPHHGVFKTLDPYKKIRVVYNGSSPSPSGYSLNNCLYAGPKLQKDIWVVLTRWRMFKYVFTADIVHMFRQILVQPKDRKWQRILWCDNPKQALTSFDLHTITYGLTSAPFLALRVLKQLALDEQAKYPLGADILLNNSYMDDFYVGAYTEAQALAVQQELISILRAGSFSLSKWASNMSKSIKVPRWLGMSSENASHIELHGFCDSSERAYAAVINVRILLSDKVCRSTLLVAKNLVAPIKVLSIPKLELYGAKLLAELLDRVKIDLHIKSLKNFAWTDSRVVLAWISGHASKWTSFVANRVSKIQSILPPKNWNYISSAKNPADIATRDITPSQLKNLKLWWHGPDWLQNPDHDLTPTCVESP
ncbi:uncharacterized protein LOC106640425 [Copidosoma floridanum]|uniref:uncharacterized protein LOC106640425 n=1 Tax=Copidosoma floridanum TaxID=29053 RepID=UPI0006C9E45B|nr:uncharacterized protein LOC106640425 [Copidosoma floridanum]